MKKSLLFWRRGGEDGFDYDGRMSEGNTNKNSKKIIFEIFTPLELNTNKIEKINQRSFAVISLSYHIQRLVEVLNRRLFAYLGHKILDDEFS